MAYDKVLVTGGSGLLGRYVVADLQANGHGVTVLDRKPPAPGVPYIEADIMDLPAVEAAVAKHEAVVHLAGLDLAIPATGEDFMRVNTMGTWHVLQAAEKAGLKKVVACSSVAATGLGEMRWDWPPQYLPVDEMHPSRPVHPYSVSKHVVEEIAQSFARRGALEVICLRPVLVLFPPLIDMVVQRERSGFRWIYYYVTPEDTARAFRLALEATGVAYDALFVTATDNASEYSTLEMVRRNRVTPFPEMRAPALYAKNPRASVFDPERAKRVIGFETATDWLQISAAARAKKA